MDALLAPGAELERGMASLATAPLASALLFSFDWGLLADSGRRVGTCFIAYMRLWLYVRRVIANPFSTPVLLVEEVVFEAGAM